MKIESYIDKVKELVDKVNQPIEPSNNDTVPTNSSLIDFIKLLLNLILDTIKLPLKFISGIIIKDIVKSIKKDAKLYAFIMGIMGVLFIFFSVLWLFLSIAVGVYFHEKGESLFFSVIYSILFQLASTTFVVLIGFFAYKKIESIKLLKEINKIKV